MREGMYDVWRTYTPAIQWYTSTFTCISIVTAHGITETVEPMGYFRQNEAKSLKKNRRKTK